MGTFQPQKMELVIVPESLVSGAACFATVEASSKSEAVGRIFLNEGALATDSVFWEPLPSLQHTIDLQTLPDIYLDKICVQLRPTNMQRPKKISVHGGTAENSLVLLLELDCDDSGKAAYEAVLPAGNELTYFKIVVSLQEASAFRLHAIIASGRVQRAKASLGRDFESRLAVIDGDDAKYHSTPSLHAISGAFSSMIDLLLQGYVSCFCEYEFRPHGL